MAEAIHVSLGRGADGRVGLHSLPQAERFYSERCGMVRVGRDIPPYPDLVYFEYFERAGADWLLRVR
jgi:hypothetical protein